MHTDQYDQMYNSFHRLNIIFNEEHYDIFHWLTQVKE